MTTCHCQYVGLADKRSYHRRRSSDRREEIHFEDKINRRSGAGRRKDVWF